MCQAHNKHPRSLSSFPFKFVPYVKAAVWPMVDTFGMSYADALALAGFTGAQFIGAPSRATLSFGRCDSNIENPNGMSFCVF